METRDKINNLGHDLEAANKLKNDKSKPQIIRVNAAIEAIKIQHRLSKVKR